jgi:hypothetical protein
MRIATLGNCQLEVVGNVLRNATNVHQGQITAVFNTPIYKLDAQKNMIDIYHELESYDVIFMQYHSEKYGPFSTKAIQQAFDVVMLPTLESRVSTPQLAYFPEPLPDLMVYVDYRLLHLYLTGHTLTQAAESYHAVNLDATKQQNFLTLDADKYQSLFRTGQLHVDYSAFYEKSLRENPDCFTTLSHPDNKNLGFLLSAIMHKLSGKQLTFNLAGEDLLNNYRAPKIGQGSQDYFMMRNTGLLLAAKINYAFFASQKRDLLKSALLSSTYYHSLENRCQNM